MNIMKLKLLLIITSSIFSEILLCMQQHDGGFQNEATHVISFVSNTTPQEIEDNSNNKNDLPSDAKKECLICNDEKPLDDFVLLPCKHNIYCFNCLHKQFRINEEFADKCPMCRSTFSLLDLQVRSHHDSINLCILCGAETNQKNHSCTYGPKMSKKNLIIKSTLPAFIALLSAYQLWRKKAQEKKAHPNSIYSKVKQDSLKEKSAIIIGFLTGASMLTILTACQTNFCPWIARASLITFLGNERYRVIMRRQVAHQSWVYPIQRDLLDLTHSTMGANIIASTTAGFIASFLYKLLHGKTQKAQVIVHQKVKKC